MLGMASFGHLAVGLAAGRALYGRGAPRAPLLKAMGAFCLLSLWPDADFAGMLLGIPYEHPLGHRGATHSLLLAAPLGLVAWALARRLGLPPVRTAVLSVLVSASHGLLDAMTFGGGLGCALWWPASVERLWMPGPEPGPLRFIPVAPLGAGMLTERGLVTVLVELVLFFPFVLYATLPKRRARASPE
jgi:inner membrane protein